MKTITATCIIHLSKEQTVTKKDITPAEAALLVGEHHKAYGDQPLEVVPDTEGEKDVNAMHLYSYLISKYGAKKVKNLYPSPTNRFPESFDEAKELGMATVNPSDKLMTYEIK